MQCRITPNSSDSQKTGDSPSGSASFGLRQGLPPLSPMSGDVSGRMLRASDLVHPSLPAALLLSLHAYSAKPKSIAPWAFPIHFSNTLETTGWHAGASQ